jgi:cobalt-zinc-cadmium resistance protein CzcA
MLLGPIMLLIVAPALQVMVVEWSQARRARKRRLAGGTEAHHE